MARVCKAGQDEEPWGRARVDLFCLYVQRDRSVTAPCDLGDGIGLSAQGLEGQAESALCFVGTGDP